MENQAHQAEYSRHRKKGDDNRYECEPRAAFVSDERDAGQVFSFYFRQHIRSSTKLFACEGRSNSDLPQSTIYLSVSRSQSSSACSSSTARISSRILLVVESVLPMKLIISRYESMAMRSAT